MCDYKLPGDYFDGETRQLELLQDIVVLSAEVRSVVNEVNRKPAYLKFKTALEDLQPVFIPCIRGENIVQRDAPAEIQTVEPIYLEDVRDYIEKYYSYTSTGSPSARLALIHHFQGKWKQFAQACVDENYHTALNALSNYFELRSLHGKEISSHIRLAVLDMLGHSKGACQSAIDSQLIAELSVYTQNVDGLQKARDKWLDHWATEIQNLWHCDVESTEWVPLLNPGWKNWDERQFGWSYQRDIYIMADVHAYFQICLARVVDVIPMLIENIISQGAPPLEWVSIHGNLAQKSPISL